LDPLGYVLSSEITNDSHDGRINQKLPTEAMTAEIIEEY
jgi:hypothetical protein